MKNIIRNTLQVLLCCVASAWVPRSEKSFPAKLSNETSFKMDSILICTRLLVNQKAIVSSQQLAERFNSYDTLTLVP